MSKPALRPEAAALYQQLAPVAKDDETYGWVTAHLCAALMGPVEDLGEWTSAADGATPWGVVLNVDTAPLELLRWLGQWDGVTPDAEAGEAEQRREIKEARGSKRGIPVAMISDIEATLTGTKSVTFRDGVEHPLEATVVVLASECPNEAATLAVLEDRRTKLLGCRRTLIVSDSPLILEGTRLIEEVAATIEAATLEDIA